MRISRELAGTIASFLTEKTKTALGKLEKEIDAMAVVEYKKTVPKELIKADQTFPDWIQKTDEITVIYAYGHSRDSYYANCGDNQVITRAGEAKLRVPRGTPLSKKIREFVLLGDRYRTLRKEAVKGLLAMGSSKRIIEQFPETASFFKDRIYLPAAPLKTDIAGLKSKLQKQ